MNTFGTYFRLTTFGESHGPAIGGIIDGMPAGVVLDQGFLNEAMTRRRPGTTAGSTGRSEADEVEVLSGFYNGRSLGTPIGFIIRNSDARSDHYDTGVFRPNHADYSWYAKYGTPLPPGGGRASARETACRVAAGAFAAMMLAGTGIEVRAWTAAIGDEVWNGSDPQCNPYNFATRCPDAASDERMQKALERARREQNTLGGIVRCRIDHVPAGLGAPLAGKLQALLAQAMLSIPAAKGFEYGDGFRSAGADGASQCDLFYMENGKVLTRTNHSGGIQGGISNGMPIDFAVAFKPIATMAGRTVATVNSCGQDTTITMKGRHDVCAVPRAVAVVEAMARLVLADMLLQSRLG